MPFRAGSYFLKCTYGVKLGSTTNYKFRHHHRNANGCHKKQVDKKKCPTSVLTSYVGKSPNVSQANSRTGQSSQYSKLTGKAVSYSCSSLHTKPNFINFMTL